MTSSANLSIGGFEVMTVRIPMRFSVEHSLAARKSAHNVLVRAVADDGRFSGWGECCPREYVTGESVESALAVLRSKVLPRLKAVSFESLDEATACLTEMLHGLGRNEQAAFCAAELAVLDLAGIRFGKSAGTVLGDVCRAEVRYSGVIATEDPETVRRMASFNAEMGVADLKVKVGRDLDSNRRLLQSVRDTVGDEVEMRIDANCAWDASECIEQLEALGEFELAGVEQPLPAEDLEGMAEVTAAGLVPVVADESLCSLEDARALAERKACDVFNLRVSKCGGLINCGRIHAVARQHGLACQLGAQVGETGILSAAGRHVATRLNSLKWREGSYGRLLLHADITEPDLTVGPGGMAPALDAPGLGVAPTLEALQEFSTESFRM